MKIDRALLINTVRPTVFGGALSLGQSAGLAAIIDEWESRPELTDERWLADILGQGFWESAQTLQPVREAFYLNPPGPDQNGPIGPAEAFRKTLSYYPFYGRGLIQDTWEDNYRKMQMILQPRFPGLDLVGNPDAALQMDISVASMFEGMIRGTFTGAKLGDYFNSTTCDWPNSRRIVNGTDHMDQIANICQCFWAGLGGTPYERDLHEGDSGQDVKLVQVALQKDGFLTGDVDGVFGPATRMAVFGFQRSRGLTIDGVVGPITREELIPSV